MRSLFCQLAIEIAETMFKDNVKQLQSMILLAKELVMQLKTQHQLFGKLCDKMFSSQLHDATNSNNDAHFIAYIRFCDCISAVGELLFCKPMGLKATVLALCDI